MCINRATGFPAVIDLQHLTKQLWNWPSALPCLVTRNSGITSLRTAEITEIRFTDGTSWHPTGIAGCVAYFNGVHLVNADSAK
ncbi:hypothetical protein FTW19_23235 [Terriglobus albidus]|uniref:Uncharacterized protein n=1 Tax=Terriglobus albidus TaxID=1592106 RepID=A0A5B9EKN9_9BACT|nr:hypothetical protein [Terriglobus albidus]QEE30646.1 hypothetical protein FTW19_23235 [Terriglobus albidus]